MESQQIFKELARLDPKLIKTKTTKYTDKKTGEQKQYSVKYITARTVMNMLDTIMGPMNWRAEFQPMGNSVIACTLYLRIDGEWLGKTDVGTSSDIEPEKGAVSDALKRAAVHWGIGRTLYNEGAASFDDDDEPQPAPADRRIPTPANGKREGRETPAPVAEEPPAVPPASELDNWLGPREPLKGGNGKGKAKKVFGNTSDVMEWVMLNNADLGEQTHAYNAVMEAMGWQNWPDAGEMTIDEFKAAFPTRRAAVTTDKAAKSGK